MASAVMLTYFLVISTLFHSISSAKIAVLLFLCSKSMKNVFDPLLNELANRGHQLTIVSPVNSTYNSKNIHVILGPSAAQFTTSFENFYEVRSRGEVLSPMRMFPFTEDICRGHYDMPGNEKFDLVLTNGLQNDCVFGLVHHLQAPFIGLSTVASPPWLSRGLGAPVPPSFVPLYLLPYTDRMTFLERVYNVYRYLKLEWERQFVFIPRLEALYKEYYPNAPSINEIQGNYSLVLMNSHPLLNYPRPNLPEMIEIGGIHCKEAQPLPKDIEDFIQSSGEHGFIVFSMGSILRGTEMPERYRQAFRNAFAKLKQKVIWKWESGIMPDAPSNVKLVQWIPQQDLLGHPKIRLFITHGGLLSTEETAYHGVPLLGIPIFADQDLNMKQAESHGYGLKLELVSISEELLTSKISTILNNPKFHDRAKYISNIFRDQINRPLDRAVYWTEYVLRHKGAPHLRSAARDLNFFQYHSIDVVGFLVGVGTVSLYLLYYIVRLILRYLFGLLLRLGQRYVPKFCNEMNERKFK